MAEWARIFRASIATFASPLTNLLTARKCTYIFLSLAKAHSFTLEFPRKRSLADSARTVKASHRHSPPWRANAQNGTQNTSKSCAEDSVEDSTLTGTRAKREIGPSALVGRLCLKIGKGCGAGLCVENFRATLPSGRRLNAKSQPYFARSILSIRLPLLRTGILDGKVVRSAHVKATKHLAGRRTLQFSARLRSFSSQLGAEHRAR